MIYIFRHRFFHALFGAEQKYNGIQRKCEKQLAGRQEGVYIYYIDRYEYDMESSNLGRKVKHILDYD